MLLTGCSLSNAQAVAKAATVYSESMKFYKCTGFASVLVIVTEDAAGASMTITQQCSPNGNDWYDPVDSGNTALGPVVSAMTVGSRYVQYSPVLSSYLRFKIVEGNVNAGTITIRLFSQE